MSFPKSEHFHQRDEQLFFNLGGEATTQLEETFGEIDVVISGICTCCHNQFHSHRENATSERNWNVLTRSL